MSVELLVAIGGVLVAIGSVLVTARFAFRTELAAAQWLQDLRTWASETIEILALAESEPDDPDGVSSSLLARLSSQIDRGRFFLPNTRQDEHGTEEPLAYRGYRHAALDPLVVVYRILDGTRKVPNRPDVLWELRRIFVSEIHQILAPNLHARQIGHLIRTSNQFRIRDVTVGGLLSNEIPKGATALLTLVVERVSQRKLQQGPE